MSDIKKLAIPDFPLEIVRQTVMEALKQAVEVNQVHNRDPIGGSNEDLFVYVSILRSCSSWQRLT